MLEHFRHWPGFQFGLRPWIPHAPQALRALEHEHAAHMRSLPSHWSRLEVAQTTRVEVSSAHYTWALNRSGRSETELARRFPRLGDWIRGAAAPTLRQLQDFAAATWSPLGSFFLPAPPEDVLPIADFRRVATDSTVHPSVHLLDTIAICQQRQAWYEEYATLYGEPSRDFVGSASLTEDPNDVAHTIASTMGYDRAVRDRATNWEDSLRRFTSYAEQVGILVMFSGIVGQNTHRKLDVEEFRGFALTSTLAPLVFVNSADAPAAQMFTLAHELAHIWLGESGVSTGGIPHGTDLRIERWCNAVAAELLIPSRELGVALAGGSIDRGNAHELARNLSREFKVSTIVMLIRFQELGYLSRDDTTALVGHELATHQRKRRSSAGGGHFYRTQARRTGRRLVQAMAVSTWEGNSTFTDTFHLLGVKGTQSFRKLCDVAGVSV